MKFLLVEEEQSISKITPELIKEFREADDTRRETILRSILNSMNDGEIVKGSKQGNLLPMFNSFRYSCYQYGIDPNQNPFIYFIPTFVRLVGSSKKFDEYMTKIIELTLKGTIPVERLEAISNG